MTESKLRIERQGPIAIVTLNDPATRNALSSPLAQELGDYFVKANADETLGCIVLAGAGDGFSSGGNVKAMLSGDDQLFRGGPQQQQEGYRTGIQMIPRSIYQCDVPIVAAVHGAAVGAGCDLACMCDIRVASTDANFSEAFLRVGLISGDGGAWFLPRVVGMPRAMEMVLTCRFIGAEEAKSWGLVTHVVERAALLDTALTLARQIAAFPPKSTRLNKRLVRNAQTMSLDSALELSAAYQAIVQSTADQKEAVRALLEKRPPRFTGK